MTMSFMPVSTRLHNALFAGIPLLKYCLVGVINTIVDFAIFSTLHLEYGVSAWKANIVSYLAAVTVSFTVNRNYTFRKRFGFRHRISRQFYRFVILNLAGMTASCVMIYWLAPTVGAILGKALTIPPVVAAGFLIARSWVFSRSSSFSRTHHRNS